MTAAATGIHPRSSAITIAVTASATVPSSSSVLRATWTQPAIRALTADHRREVERVGPDDHADARVVGSLDQRHQGGGHLRPVRRDRRQQPDRHLRQPVLRAEPVEPPREGRRCHQRDGEGDDEQRDRDRYSHAPTPERKLGRAADHASLGVAPWRGDMSSATVARRDNRVQRARLCADRERAVRVADELLRERDSHRLDRPRRPPADARGPSAHQPPRESRRAPAERSPSGHCGTVRAAAIMRAQSRRDAAANTPPTQLGCPQLQRRIGARIDASSKLVVKVAAPRENGDTRGHGTLNRKATGTLHRSGKPLPTSLPGAPGAKLTRLRAATTARTTHARAAGTARGGACRTPPRAGAAVSDSVQADVAVSRAGGGWFAAPVRDDGGGDGVAVSGAAEA